MHAILLPVWLGGGRKGHEWLGERKANGGLGDSWAVNLNTGNWLHGAGDESGLDLVSLYAALNHLDQLAALKQVAEQVGVTSGRAQDALPRQKSPEAKPEPIPEDAPPIPDHFRHGTASAVYAYGSAFRVARYDLADRKEFSPFTWRGGKWQAKGYPEPRPLYGVADLAKRPDAPVIIVEGEKCANMGALTLRKYVVLTWASGTNSIKKNDWAPLAGRDVIIWPDADVPGREAAAWLAGHLAASCTRLRVIDPKDKPQGWDIADAIAEGWSAKAIATWASENIVTIPAPTPSAASPTAVEPSQEGSSVATAAPATDFMPVGAYEPDVPASSMVRWADLNLETNQGGLPYPTLANASQILRIHPELQGKLWFDTFQQKIWHSMHGVKKEWTDADSSDLTVFIQQTLKLNKFTLDLVNQGVMHAARRNSRNGLTDWLNSLEWDGHPRLDDWLGDTLGVERSPYTVAVANNWPISMVARAFRPGVQADHMPVLEGKMGRGKSSFLAILGGEWYDAITTAIGDKDFLQSLQGTWLVEIPDMAGFGRREHGLIISTISIRKDRYRASYGRYVEDHQRGCILSATSENDEYLQDARGRRRFWPLRCTAIDLDALHAMRESIFAEAVAKYKAGSAWYEMPDTTEDEQDARVEQDMWTDDVLNYAQSMWDQAGGKSTQITSTLLLSSALEIRLRDQSQKEKNRIAAILRGNGWIQHRSAGKRWWIRPFRRD